MTVRRIVEPNGGVAIAIAGRVPAMLDRWQRAAFVAAVAALGDA
jgi:hypothetical protein